MATSPARGGSSVSARSVSPSLDLAKLCELLAAALPPQHGQSQASLPFLSIDKSKLTVNTRGVLHRLFTADGFLSGFAPGPDTGFVRDIELPAIGTTARVGGRLLAGSEGPTSRAIEKLQASIAEAVEAALSGIDAPTLAAESVAEALKILAKSVQERQPDLPTTATLVPVTFAGNDRRYDERGQDIGRVLSAIETVDGRDGLELLLRGVSNLLSKDGWDDDEVEETLAAIRTQRNRPGSQIKSFLNFLDDEALARVRLQVTMRLMTALANQSKSSGFVAYVQRVKACFDLFGSAKGSALVLDVSSVFGQANITNISEYLRKALFYFCLPVWPEWSVQLFETHTEPTQGYATVREVSYRFRVNGKNPLTSKSAFDSRLDKIWDRVLASPGPDAFVRKQIAELTFLSLVVPSSLTAPAEIDILTEARRIEAAVKASPEAALDELHAELRRRSHVVDALASELIDLLKSKVNRLVTAANNTADRFTVSLHRNIVNREALDSITEKTDILVKTENGPDNIAWFEHLTISDDAVVPGSIASYNVSTELKERSLAVNGPAASVSMSRDLSDAALAIRFVPYRWLQREQEWVADPPNTGVFDAGSGVEVQYDLRTLRRSDVKDDQKATAEQYRSAALTAFTVLVYATLWELQRRIRGDRVNMVTLLLRLQHTGRKVRREDDASDANTAIYAASQAIEKALAREGAIKLQGLTTIAEGAAKSLQWKRRGALHALLGGQATRFQMDGSLGKVALISYVTRPCDSHPMHTDADGYLFVGRTYTANKEENGAVLRTLRMRSRLVESRREFSSPQPILEEIRRLNDDGYQHVMLLSHHYGNRHIGRAADRHAPHGTSEFLDEAVERFPDMSLYTLRRDVFPATRLRKRDQQESGFEVLNFKDHQDMYDAQAHDILRGILPIYTFATLSVVGDEGERPQSGFCTYFFDVDQRINNLEARETVRANIMGVAHGGDVRRSLISVLRAIHFMESEKPASNALLLPVLDPFDWANPPRTAATGEIEIMSRRGSRSVLLSLPAVLAHVTKVLHKDDK